MRLLISSLGTACLCWVATIVPLTVNAQLPVHLAITPSSGPVGTEVTITDSGFVNNEINENDVIFVPGTTQRHVDPDMGMFTAEQSGIRSPDGEHITFQVPRFGYMRGAFGSLPEPNSQPPEVTPGVYSVFVNVTYPDQSLPHLIFTVTDTPPFWTTKTLLLAFASGVAVLIAVAYGAYRIRTARRTRL